MIEVDVDITSKPRLLTVILVATTVICKIIIVGGLILLAALAFRPAQAQAEPMIKVAPSWTRLISIEGTSWHASSDVRVENDELVTQLRLNSGGKVSYLATRIPLDACRAGAGLARVGVESLSFDLGGSHVGDRIARLVCTAGELLQSREGGGKLLL